MNLRERAAFAHVDKVATDEMTLAGRAIIILSRLIETEVTDDWQATVVNPYAKPPAVEITVEGLAFKVSIDTVVRTSKSPNATDEQSHEWEEEAIQVWVQRAQAWCPVESLADVGRVFKLDPLPDIEAETQTPAETSDESVEAEQ